MSYAFRLAKRSAGGWAGAVGHRRGLGHWGAVFARREAGRVLSPSELRDGRVETTPAEWTSTLQGLWRDGRCRVGLHCHADQVRDCPKLVETDMVDSSVRPQKTGIRADEAGHASLQPADDLADRRTADVRGVRCRGNPTSKVRRPLRAKGAK